MVLSPYAGYVWSAYVISLAAIGVTVAVTVAKWRIAKKRLQAIKDSETNL